MTGGSQSLDLSMALGPGSLAIASEVSARFALPTSVIAGRGPW